MRGAVVALPNDPELASSLGKKGTANGILFFNRKINGIALTALAAVQTEGKYYTYAQIVMLANVVVLSSKNVDAFFGEMLVASSLLHKKVLITADSEVGKLLKSAGVDYKIVAKESLQEALLDYVPRQSAGFAEVNLDRAFPVAGIGDVALGVVTRGSIKKHDVLFHSSGAQVTIRSIQIQDEDVDLAEEGTRVGVSLKGIKYDEIDKGDVLASTLVKSTSSFKAELSLSKFVQGVKAEGRWQFVKNFSVSNATVEKSGDVFEVGLDKAVPLKDGDSFLLLRREIPRIAASGTVILR
ncbi:MAG: EF-Tu/IF-2/RF-3 family GTPase [Candidatus Micrarchaeaceae archaeon]